MLSASSWLAPERVDKDLASATTAVAEGTLFAFVDELDLAAWQAEAAAVAAQPWISGAVEFTGPARGSLKTLLPASLAGELASAMLGSDTAVAGPEVEDLVGEITNMICGGWLSAQAPHATFDLTPPVVHRRPSLGTAEAAGPAAWLMVNGAPLAVTLTVTDDAR